MENVITTGSGVISGNRARMNLSQTAKGLWQIDVTVEFPTVEEATANLSQAIDSIKDLMKAKGLVEASI